MFNKRLKKLFVVLPILGVSLGVVAGCSKFDESINDLQAQVDRLSSTVEGLQKLVNDGKVVTGVNPTSDGITITFSDGTTAEVKNGQDGQNGKNGTTWAIGEDGYWYQDGAKTEFKAVPTNGTNGQYYVPNTTKEGENANYGNFDIYQDGKLVEHTDISWLSASSGMTAVKKGNTLEFHNVEGVEGGVVTITLGTQLGSVAFVPTTLNAESTYPTTDKPFYHATRHYAEATGKQLNDMEKSNIVEMHFRKSPADAYVEGAALAFINREVKTRAVAGDATTLLNIVETKKFTTEDPNIDLNVTLNPKALKANEYDFAALQVWPGQSAVTSDYVHITSDLLTPVLADTTRTVKGQLSKQFYNRFTTNNDLRITDTDADIKACAGDPDDAVKGPHFKFKYDSSINLREKVGLYTDEVKDWLYSLGIRGMSYKFSLPKEYLADDEMKTNQQYFVELDEETGVLKVNTNTDKVANPIVAVGRTPVVRCDAYLLDNAGVQRWVASAYIKVNITEEVVDEKDKDDLSVDITDAAYPKEYNYRLLTGTFPTEDVTSGPQVVGVMDWARINNNVYAAVNLPAKRFWDEYGGTNNEFTVKVDVATDATTGTSNVLPVTTFNADGRENQLTGAASGIQVTVNFNAQDDKTSHVHIAINKQVKTQHTYYNSDQKGAKYIVTITIKSDDTKRYPNVVLTQEFYVSDPHEFYTYNNFYHFTQSSISAHYADFDKVKYGSNAEDLVIVKGKLNASQVYEMAGKVHEHFAMTTDYKTIFDYVANPTATYDWDSKEYPNGAQIARNVSGIEFQWTKQPVTDVTPTVSFSTDEDVALNGAMKDPFLVRNMTLTETLVNGEKCPTNYDVVFVNPFVAGTIEGVQLYGNSRVPVSEETKPSVVIVDREKEVILNYDETAQDLELSTYATAAYKVANPNVTFAQKTGENWPKGLEVNTTTGKITWKNDGQTLNADRTYHVTVTVEFTNLSIVTFDVPVTLTMDPIE